MFDEDGVYQSDWLDKLSYRGKCGRHTHTNKNTSACEELVVRGRQRQVNSRH